jgi:hypothetical protein
MREERIQGFLFCWGCIARVSVAKILKINTIWEHSAVVATACPCPALRVMGWIVIEI